MKVITLINLNKKLNASKIKLSYLVLGGGRSLRCRRRRRRGARLLKVSSEYLLEVTLVADGVHQLLDLCVRLHPLLPQFLALHLLKLCFHPVNVVLGVATDVGSRAAPPPLLLREDVFPSCVLRAVGPRPPGMLGRP